ncbi:hypothetical protein GCM10011351_22440 [Paraliobacillus quinghaiensis]|uniref:Fluoride-specific ion channel FluC n=1 Tax=Paraliobacillus quinghaiensis TaxID=470815 RepID=A0A917WWQ5_9BACI|nr:fluoride efflux transporter CrcB [Paraliobacillus quinghaiensis]GGM35931.1 hypothetical protein GCM10011351_22440 [Paraliobacillus quinghaiensis]
MSNLISYKTFLLIGVGGAIGASMRYSLNLLVPFTNLPYATIIVNILGCFILAFSINNGQLKARVPEPFLLALNTGILGSFTTFSTFSIESIQLLTVNLGTGFIYIILNLFGGLAACLCGYLLAKQVDKAKNSDGGYA